jgi:hypothetical protein
MPALHQVGCGKLRVAITLAIVVQETQAHAGIEQRLQRDRVGLRSSSQFIGRLRLLVEHREQPQLAGH